MVDSMALELLIHKQQTPLHALSSLGSCSILLPLTEIWLFLRLSFS